MIEMFGEKRTAAGKPVRVTEQNRAGQQTDRKFRFQNWRYAPSASTQALNEIVEFALSENPKNHLSKRARRDRTETAGLVGGRCLS